MTSNATAVDAEGEMKDAILPSYCMGLGRTHDDGEDGDDRPRPPKGHSLHGVRINSDYTRNTNRITNHR